MRYKVSKLVENGGYSYIVTYIQNKSQVTHNYICIKSYKFVSYDHKDHNLQWQLKHLHYYELDRELGTKKKTIF